MSTVVAVSVPLFSHYFPVTRLAEELQRRGHQVTYISSQWSLPGVKSHFPTLSTIGIQDNLKDLLLGSQANLLRAAR
jgi:UDP:flavonoid glycosyltransferase YjiC (YdhE family)